jgi:predicted SnoaL-like aldol condensation-catalyzing enzyme
MATAKDIAVDFLAMVTAGKIDEAYEKYIDLSGKHHNVHTPAGMEALREGMKGADRQFPDLTSTVKQALVDGDRVAVYSHIVMKPGEPGMAALHIVRVADGKIVELWDCVQPIPKDSPNSDGAF